MNHKAMYMHGNGQLKSRVSQGVWSPKNTKNTPQIVIEGREKKQELRSHRAHQRYWHMAGIKNGESTQRRKQLKQTQPNRQNPKEGETEKQEKRQQGSDGLS